MGMHGGIDAAADEKIADASAVENTTAENVTAAGAAETTASQTTEGERVFAGLDEAEWSSISDDGFLRKRILREGTGDENPTPGATISVHYVGTLLENGIEFDSSRKRSSEFKFKLGHGEVIQAWDIAVATMKRNELCEIVCAPVHGYGAAGAPPKIPGNAYLKFEIELLSFIREPETWLERIEYAEKKKGKGDALVRLGSYQLAIPIYEDGLNQVRYTWQANSDEEKRQLSRLKTQITANLSLCQYKAGDYGATIKAAEDVLAEDKNNVKVLLRLALSAAAIADFAKAKDAVARAAETSSDPAIKFVRTEVEECEKRHKRNIDSLYKKMSIAI